MDTLTYNQIKKLSRQNIAFLWNNKLKGKYNGRSLEPIEKLYLMMVEGYGLFPNHNNLRNCYANKCNEILTKHDGGKKYYKYQSFNELSISALVNKYTWISSPRSFNDPYDCALIKNFELRKALLSTFKVLSLSKDYKNVTMWGHYSDNHKGFCIEYTSKKADPKELELRYFTEVSNKIQLSESVIYKSTDEINESLNSIDKKMTSIVDMYSSKEKSDISLVNDLIDILVTKHDNWKYEDELRLILDLDYNIIPHPGKVSKIFLGEKMSEINKVTIYNLINSFYEDCEVHVMKTDTYRYKMYSEKFDINEIKETNAKQLLNI